MAKRGRPKRGSVAKNRIVSVVLTEKALILYRKMRTQSNNGSKWFHSFVSRALIDKFGKNFDEELFIEQIKMYHEARTKDIQVYDLKIQQLAEELRQLQKKKADKKAQKILKSFSKESEKEEDGGKQDGTKTAVQKKAK